MTKFTAGTAGLVMTNDRRSGRASTVSGSQISDYIGLEISSATMKIAYFHAFLVRATLRPEPPRRLN